MQKRGAAEGGEASRSRGRARGSSDHPDRDRGAACAADAADAAAARDEAAAGAVRCVCGGRVCGCPAAAARGYPRHPVAAAARRQRRLRELRPQPGLLLRRLQHLAGRRRRGPRHGGADAVDVDDGVGQRHEAVHGRSGAAAGREGTADVGRARGAAARPVAHSAERLNAARLLWGGGRRDDGAAAAAGAPWCWWWW